MKLIHSRKRPPPAAAPRTPGAILEVSDLEVDFSGGQGPRAVQGLSLALTPGRVVGIAGESGSGKSVSALSIIGLLPRTAHVEGSIRYRGEELVGTSERLGVSCAAVTSRWCSRRRFRPLTRWCRSGAR